VDELYVLARRTLLDALEAIGSHRDSMVLVGAQAIYLRVGEANIAVAPYTIDGDLAIDPSLLAEIPPLEQALLAAGFRPKDDTSVGIWLASRKTSSGQADVAIDLLVPRTMSPGQGKRAARLPGHDVRSARIVTGLEGVIVDSDSMTIPSLDALDSRAFLLKVAGPAALLIAKLSKIHDRQGSPRLLDKDALDAYRLLRGTAAAEMSRRYERVLNDDRTQAVARDGQRLLREQFGDARAPGIEMVQRATAGLVDPEEIAASCVALADELLLSIAG
jgi:hypothetical protein